MDDRLLRGGRLCQGTVYVFHSCRCTTLIDENKQVSTDIDTAVTRIDMYSGTDPQSRRIIPLP